MFGGLPTPTDTEAPETLLTAVPPSAVSDYAHQDCDGSPTHEDHLTSSQSAHVTLR